MKILVIFPRYNPVDYWHYDPFSRGKIYSYQMPLGLPYISAALKAEGFNVDFQNQNHIEGLIKDVVRNALGKTYYDFVFTGGLTMSYPNLKDLVGFIREVSPDTKIVIGGGIISAQPEIMMNLLKPDFGVMFEGEETCVDLVQCVNNNGDLKQVKGILFWDNGVLTRTEPHPSIMDLDALPFPDMEGIGLMEFMDQQKSEAVALDTEDFPRQYPLLSARSCSFSCTFCFHTTGRKYRQRSINNIMKEIKMAVEKYRANYIYFQDEMFAYDKPRALEFCQKFWEYAATVPYKLKFWTQMRVDFTDEEILDALKSANCPVVGLGLESMSQNVLTSMRKKITPEQIEKCLTTITKKHMSYQGSFIFGDTAETLETAKETCNFYMNRQDIIRGAAVLNFIVGLPGSPVYKKWIKDKGIDEVALILERAKGYDPKKTENMTKLNTKDFNKLLNMVYTAEYLGAKYAMPVSEQHINGKHEIVCTCPYCGRTVVFPNVHLSSNIRRGSVICRYDDCRGRFTIAGRWYPLTRILVKTFGHHPLYHLKTKIFGEGAW